MHNNVTDFLAALIPDRSRLSAHTQNSISRILVGKEINLTQSADYILYRGFLMVSVASLSVTTAVFTHAFIQRSKINLQDSHLLNAIDVFSVFAAIAASLITILVFIRIIFASNICSTNVPLVIGSNALRGRSKGTVIKKSVIGIVTGLFCIFMTHIPAKGLIVHYGLEDSAPSIFLMLILQAYGIGVGHNLIISSLLIMTKARRCFDALQLQLSQIKA